MGRNERGLSVQETFSSFVKRGKIKGYISVNKFGRNPDLDTVIEDIQSNGGIYVWNTSPEIINLSSDDSEDNFVTGSGTREVSIQGIDANFDYLTENVYMSGTDISPSTNTFFRVNRLEAISQGTYGRTNVSNAGLITASGSSSDVVHGIINNTPTALGQSQIARYSIPRNHYGILEKITINIDSNKTSDILLFVRENAMQVTAPFGSVNMKRNWDAISGFNDISLEGAIYIDATNGADIWFAGIGGQASTLVDVTFDLHVYPILQ